METLMLFLTILAVGVLAFNTFAWIVTWVIVFRNPWTASLVRFGVLDLFALLSLVWLIVRYCP